MIQFMGRCSLAALGLAMIADGAAAQAQLEEIVVTAERRSESLQDTPISVVSLSASGLDSKNITNVQDLQNFLPNVSIGGSVPAGASAPDFSIRGIGQTSARASNERGVGLYIDDIYYPRATGSLLSLGDVQRVEVLRGPQGTLFGRNNTGGAIRYFRNTPSDELEVEGKVTVGSYERVDASLLVNVPLGDKAAFRGQVATFNREGYVKVIGTGRTLGDQDEMAVRGALRFRPTEDVTIDLTAAYSESKSSGDPTVVFGTGNAGPSVAPYSLYLTRLGQPAIVTDDRRWVSPDGYSVYSRCILDSVPVASANFGGAVDRLSGAVAPGTFCADYREGDSTFLSASLEWKINDNLTFKSLTGYNDGKDSDEGDYGLFGATTNRVRNTMRSGSQEFQLLGAYDRLDFVAGLYYFEETPTETIINRQLAIVAGSPQCCTGFDRYVGLDTKSVALFGQATYDVTSRLSVTGGIRQTRDEKSAVISKTGVYTPVIANADRTQRVSDDWQATDGRVTVDYKWTDDIMTYATLSRGFKSGGFNGEIALVNGRATVEPYDPEYVTNHELGIRSQFFDNRLRANLTAFFMKFDDTVIQYAEFAGGGTQTRFLNAGKLDISGFEAEFVLAVTEGLTLAANVGHTDLEYKALGVDSPLFPLTCPAPRTLANCTPQPLARTPEWTYTLGVDYRRPMFGGDLLVSLNYANKGEQFSGNSTSNSILLREYGLTNVRLQFNSSSYWQVALFGSNITDEAYYTSGLDGRFNGNPVGTLIRGAGEPRAWGLTFTAKY